MLRLLKIHLLRKCHRLKNPLVLRTQLLLKVAKVAKKEKLLKTKVEKAVKVEMVKKKKAKTARKENKKAKEALARGFRRIHLNLISLFPCLSRLNSIGSLRLMIRGVCGDWE